MIYQHLFYYTLTGLVWTGGINLLLNYYGGIPMFSWRQILFNIMLWPLSIYLFIRAVMADEPTDKDKE